MKLKVGQRYLRNGSGNISEFEIITIPDCGAPYCRIIRSPDPSYSAGQIVCEFTNLGNDKMIFKSLEKFTNDNGYNVCYYFLLGQEKPEEL